MDAHIEDPVGTSCRARDTRCAAEFVAAIRPRLVGALLRWLRDPDKANDIAQETLTRILSRWDNLEEIADLEGYVFRVAFNVAHSIERRTTREHRTVGLLTTVPLRSIDHDARLDLDRAVRALPPRQRETIVRRFYMDSSVAETASAMRCASGTVKATTSQALDSLRAACASSA